MKGHLPACALCGKFLPLDRSGGGIGRHVRLRGVCRKACGFKSRPEHDLLLSFAMGA
jgi:recombinational DNA repair protein (RecF pathway)